MDVNLIAAVGRSGQLGLDGRLPWSDPKDLAWFRHMTMDGFVVVGKSTAKKLPPLIHRKVFVQERRHTVEEIFMIFEEWKSKMFLTDPPRFWIAGGAQIYQFWLPHVTRSFITHINYDGPADVFMPNLWRN